jgi:hypothetical protein
MVADRYPVRTKYGEWVVVQIAGNLFDILH